MLGGWFNDKGTEQDRRASAASAGISVDGGTIPTSEPYDSRSRSRSPTTGTGKDKSTETRSGLRQSVPPQLQTHDEIVKDMDDRLESIRRAGLPQMSGPSEHVSPSETPGPSEPPDGKRLRPLENVYDPFNGQSIGLLAPGEFSTDEDAIWTHLKQIRDLQSDIAMMHGQMEGLGGNERHPRRRETTGDDDAVNVEEEAKAAKAAEFKKLAERFTGRKDAIDAVMAKVCNVVVRSNHHRLKHYVMSLSA